MEREEAIELLSAYGVPLDEEKFQEAIDMAIEALSEPSGMWIDTQGNQLKIGGYSGYCSACHAWSEYLTDYCGKCGAYMVKENE